MLSKRDKSVVYKTTQHGDVMKNVPFEIGPSGWGEILLRKPGTTSRGYFRVPEGVDGYAYLVELAKFTRDRLVRKFGEDLGRRLLKFDFPEGE